VTVPALEVYLRVITKGTLTLGMKQAMRVVVVANPGGVVTCTYLVKMKVLVAELLAVLVFP
jgi:hypothetical protein